MISGCVNTMHVSHGQALEIIVSVEVLNEVLGSEIIIKDIDMNTLKKSYKK